MKAVKEPEFLLSAAKPEQFPAGTAGEVAFAGRSNVGKSSLINRLTGRPNLAFTSSRPGCTRTINFYEIEPGLRFVDLPGYGFAEGPRADKTLWKALIEKYLLEREQLKLVVMSIDSRRGWMAQDRQLKEFLDRHGRPYIVAATKVDKLNRKEFVHGMRAIREELAEGEPVPFSAPDGRGVRELWQAITRITNRAS
jgi:GTP-binding protein